jgi:hypothetical protein
VSPFYRDFTWSSVSVSTPFQDSSITNDEERCFILLVDSLSLGHVTDSRDARSNHAPNILQHYLRNPFFSCSDLKRFDSAEFASSWIFSCQASIIGHQTSQCLSARQGRIHTSSRSAGVYAYATRPSLRARRVPVFVLAICIQVLLAFET